MKSTESLLSAQESRVAWSRPPFAGSWGMSAWLVSLGPFVLVRRVSGREGSFPPGDRGRQQGPLCTPTVGGVPYLWQVGWRGGAFLGRGYIPA